MTEEKEELTKSDALTTLKQTLKKEVEELRGRLEKYEVKPEKRKG